jgi:hypothetical protein
LGLPHKEKECSGTPQISEGWEMLDRLVIGRKSAVIYSVFWELNATTNFRECITKGNMLN